MYTRAIILLVFGCFVLQNAYGYFIAGGLSEARNANGDIQEIILQFKDKAEEYMDKAEPYEMFKAVSYATQVVAGTNYFIKVQVGENDFIHMKVFKPLPYTRKPMSFVAAIDNMKKGDKIKYF